MPVDPKQIAKRHAERAFEEYLREREAKAQAEFDAIAAANPDLAAQTANLLDRDATNLNAGWE